MENVKSETPIMTIQVDNVFLGLLLKGLSELPAKESINAIIKLENGWKQTVDAFNEQAGEKITKGELPQPD